MVRFTGGLLLFTAFTAAAPPDPHPHALGLQQPLTDHQISSQPAPRKLQGRFLHITDFHPDPFYKLHSDPAEACHSGQGQAGHYGAEVTDCDTPFSLVNATFKWIEENIKDHIDFVVWTGDSARHDNDDRYPRTDKQVIKLNRYLVDKFVETFGKPDNLDDPDPTNDFVVPIVPTFGNNDILPHNIFQPGPNKWTREYDDLWDKFVPQEQRHSFARGGWFFSEVIPNKLAIFSLNSLYFFDSNSAVDGCDADTEPGYEHFEWLRIQLHFLRQRGMKAILIGHVPPARTANKQNWDESCYQKYTLWLRQYRDVVVTSIFGHMNIDHFMFQDVTELTYKFKIRGIDDEFDRVKGLEALSNNETFSIAAKAQYLNDLREGWTGLPKPPKGASYVSSEAQDYDLAKKKKKKHKGGDLDKFLAAIGGPWGERFSLSLVSPSVVPNFFPTLRIIEYNISGLENHSPAGRAIGTPATAFSALEGEDEDDYMIEDLQEMEIPLRTSVDRDDTSTGLFEEADSDELHDFKKKRKKSHKKKKKKARPSFPVPKPPSKISPPGPAYSPQTLSLISWRQYFANLTEINDDIHSDSLDVMKEHHKHFKFKVEYHTNNDSNYQMKDLTVRAWLDLAEKVARDKYSASSEDILDDTTNSPDDDNGIDELKKDDKTKGGNGGKEKVKKARNHLWRVFIKRAFVHTKPDEEIDQDFGSYE